MFLNPSAEREAKSLAEMEDLRGGGYWRFENWGRLSNHLCEWANVIWVEMMSSCWTDCRPPGARGLWNPVGWMEPATISHMGTSQRCMFFPVLEFAQQRPLETHQERQTDGKEIIAISTGSHFQSTYYVPSSVSATMGLQRVGHDWVTFTSLHLRGLWNKTWWPTPHSCCPFP